MNAQEATYSALIRAMSPDYKLDNHRIPEVVMQALKNDRVAVFNTVRAQIATTSSHATCTPAKKIFPKCFFTIGFQWHPAHPAILIGFGLNGRYITENEPG